MPFKILRFLTQRLYVCFCIGLSISIRYPPSLYNPTAFFCVQLVTVYSYLNQDDKPTLTYIAMYFKTLFHFRLDLINSVPF